MRLLCWKLLGPRVSHCLGPTVRSKGGNHTPTLQRYYTTHSHPLMANFKPPSLEFLDDDEEFLSQLEAAEAQAISQLSSTKRRRSSPSPDTDPGVVRVKLENPADEGAYTAALRGSKSLAWQNQSQVSGESYAPRPAVAGGGACYKCGKEGHWARECTQSSTGEAEKSCPCGLGACLVLTANTERNRGRKFFRCPTRQENGGCGFFEWCDEPSGNTTSATDRAWKNGSQPQFNQRPSYQTTSDFTKPRNEYDNGTNSSYGAYPKFEASDNKSYGMKNSSTCFKCGKEGHWARDCPAAPSSNSTTPGSAGEKGMSSYSDTCYKCNQSGHWAKDCSQSATAKPRNW